MRYESVGRRLSRISGDPPQSDFHLWYDEGISPGADWSRVLAERIEACAVFLYFVTPTSVVRENCRRAELRAGIHNKGDPREVALE